MMLPLVVFAFVVGLVMAAYFALANLPGILAGRELESRLRDLSVPLETGSGDDSSVVRQEKSGPLPAIDRVLDATRLGHSLKRLIERSGVETTPSAMVMAAIVGAIAAAFVGSLLTNQASFCRLRTDHLSAPFLWMRFKRASYQTVRGTVSGGARPAVARNPRRPRVSDRDGHGRQRTAGAGRTRVQENVRAAELRPAAEGCSTSWPIVCPARRPVFVTAVLIQRDTGGNLAEILDNLAHVVRERFKILRQVRVHTAHGRFTGYVLLALPAFLSVALMWINPEHMGLLFTEHMGHVMLVIALTLQTVGFFWIRQVIKIEV